MDGVRVVLHTVEFVVRTLADSCFYILILLLINRYIQDDSRVTTDTRLQFLLVNAALNCNKLEAVAFVGITFAKHNTFQFVYTLILNSNRQTLNEVINVILLGRSEALELVDTSRQLVCIDVESVSAIIFPATNLIAIFGQFIGVELDIIKQNDVLRTSYLFVSKRVDVECEVNRLACILR